MSLGQRRGRFLRTISEAGRHEQGGHLQSEENPACRVWASELSTEGCQGSAADLRQEDPRPAMCRGQPLTGSLKLLGKPPAQDL